MNTIDVVVKMMLVVIEIDFVYDEFKWFYLCGVVFENY